uniref:Uncharacterized protein n=1 Tax=Oryza punctata TaxID=4537 RepID=A0A0E0L4E8_ORYPU
MGKTPKGGLLHHAGDNLRPEPGTAVERAVVPLLPNGPSTKGHNRIEPTTTLPWDFETARAVPFVEGNLTDGEAMRKTEAREDDPPQLKGFGKPAMYMAWKKNQQDNIGTTRALAFSKQEQVYRVWRRSRLTKIDGVCRKPEAPAQGRRPYPTYGQGKVQELGYDGQ